MSEGYQPYPSTEAETELLPSVPSSAADDQSTAELAKEQAADVAQTGVQAGQHVASVAKEQAGNVTAEAGRQAKDLLGQARSELSQQATAQQQRVADGLKSLSEQLHSMSRHSDQPGIAADLARQGAQVTEQAASWFDGREPGALLDEVRSFARRRPGTFLLMAAGAGLLAGRLTRGLKDQSSDGSDTGQPAGTRSAELTTGGAALGYPRDAGLTTGLPSGGYSSGGAMPPAGGYAMPATTGEYDGGMPPTAGGYAMPPAGGDTAEDLIPFPGQDGELDRPRPGEPR